MKPLATLLTVCCALSLNAHADELADIKASGTLTCGVFGDIVPLGYQDSKTRSVVGFDVDVCAAIAQDLNVKLDVKTLSVEGRIPALLTGRVNVVAAAMGYTPVRAKQIDFSSAYYQMPIPVLVKSDSGLKTLADLKGKSISAIRASTPELFARQVLTDSNIVTFDDGASAYLALQQNKVQGMAMSLGGAVGFRNRSNGQTVFLDQPLHWEPDCIGVKKGEPALLAAINASLNKLEASGRLQVIWDRWFGPTTEYKLKREKKVTPISQFQ
ncbi:transporter substrate-binding domain-containing protein [Paraburkholderia diazotrophica]|uniref:transporter substrate-binding domain-containing protein n=1 Tax=Paraburkholderia diazotrophica TaxID=667676 RepID=UPI003172DB2E